MSLNEKLIMEKELNIAAILKDKPTETKLWSPMLGDCIYCYNNTYPEEIIIAFTDKNGEEKEWIFSYSGRTISAPDTAEVCLFPSKQMQDWSKFAWKKGDVLSCGVDNLCIFKKWENDEYTEFDAEFVTPDYSGAILKTKDWVNVTNENIVKQHISKVEEIKGGKLNLETLEIEQPKQEFKDGDIVAFGESVAIYKKFENDELYFYACIEAAWGLILSDSVNTSLEYRLATDSEKQQLFDTLTKEGKRWNPDTKQIEDLPKKCELKPFDKVLVKIAGRTWTADFFSHYDENDEELPYVCIGYGRVTHCIPYNEETKHLLGTTDEWKGGEQ
jgi:hypothetical protein|nr:MAG TPA: hypothetical protein [Caudoviricetes sp.]